MNYIPESARQIVNKYLDTYPEQERNDLLYNYLACETVTKRSLKQFVSRLQSKKSVWDTSIYDMHRRQVEEEELFLSVPFEVEEGVLQCGKCGSKKTISYQRQTRSLDEGATTFAQCVNCGTRWRHNN